MEVILLEKVGKLGEIGDKVNVKSGFGRNFLVPRGKAVFATAQNVADFEHRRDELEAAAQEKLSQAQQRGEKLAALENVTITAQAGEEGKLFGSVGARDIADAITAAGESVSKSEVKLPEGTLRDVGEFPVDLQLHAEVVQSVTIAIVAE